MRFWYLSHMYFGTYHLYDADLSGYIKLCYHSKKPVYNMPVDDPYDFHVKHLLAYYKHVFFLKRKICITKHLLFYSHG